MKLWHKICLDLKFITQFIKQPNAEFVYVFIWSVTITTSDANLFFYCNILKMLDMKCKTQK